MNSWWAELEDRNDAVTMEVHQEPRSFLVIYSNDDGRKFRLRFNAKPNPIGFLAKLPGGRT